MLEKIIFNIVKGIYSRYLLTHPYNKARCKKSGFIIPGMKLRIFIS